VKNSTLSLRRESKSLISQSYCVVLLGVVPSFDQAVAHRVAGGLVSAIVVEVESGASERVLHVVYDRALNGSLVVADVRAHQLPDLFGTLPTMA